MGTRVSWRRKHSFISYQEPVRVSKHDRCDWHIYLGVVFPRGEKVLIFQSLFLFASPICAGICLLECWYLLLHDPTPTVTVFHTPRASATPRCLLELPSPGVVGLDAHDDGVHTEHDLNGEEIVINTWSDGTISREGRSREEVGILHVFDQHHFAYNSQYMPVCKQLVSFR